MRFFGEHPVPQVRHNGWVYYLILSGSACVVMRDSRRVLEPGDICVFHPDCATGWEAAGTAKCEVLVWIWREAPKAAIIPVTRGGHLVGRTSPALRKDLRSVHDACRLAVACPDALTRYRLEIERVRLEYAVARTLQKKSEVSPDRIRLGLAQEWCRNNLANPSPIKGLCEYLQISAPTLFRVFQGCGAKSPGDYHRSLRMDAARQWISQEGLLVKQAAFRLGYKNANDFSRAFAAFHGVSPSRSGTEAAGIRRGSWRRG